MSAPTSQLSQENILRDVHDPVTQTLRTTATTLPPVGAATSANQDTEIASLASIDSKLTSPLTVTVNPLSTGTNTIGSVKVTDGTNTAAVLNVAPVSDTGQPALAVRVISQLGAGTGGGGGTVEVVIDDTTDSIKIGNGSGIFAQVNASREILVKDTAAEASLSSIDSKLTSPLAVTGTFFQATQPISIASAISTKSPVNTNGSIVNTTLTATTASTASVPANAVGFILEAEDTNTHNIRWCVGGTASTTVGMLTEPGRDSGFVPCAANISICAVTSGTNAFSIQWILSV